jgi:hypothetical protein
MLEFNLPTDIGEGAVGRLDDLGRLGNTDYVLELRMGSFGDWPVWWRLMVDGDGITQVEVRNKNGFLSGVCRIDAEAELKPGHQVWGHRYVPWWVVNPQPALLVLVYQPLDTEEEGVPAYAGNLDWDDDHLLHPFVD